MHAWEGKPFREVDLLTQRRDPRRFIIGCATRNPADSKAICLQWFRNIPEISQWLRRMEPQRWGVNGAALIAKKAELEPILTLVDVHGIAPAFIEAHNRVSRPQYELLWWGSFPEFAAGIDTRAAQLLTAVALEPIDPADSEQARAMALALRGRVAAD